MYKKIIMFLIIIGTSFLITGCGVNKGELINTNDKSELYVDSFTKADNEYFLYFYSDRCGHCISIAEIINGYRLNGAIPLYKVNLTRETLSTWEEFGIRGTPTLYHVINFNGKIYIKEKVVGSTDIVNYLD